MAPDAAAVTDAEDIFAEGLDVNKVVQATFSMVRSALISAASRARLALAAVSGS